MTVSLLNVMLADKVTALLDDPHVRVNVEDEHRGFTRDQASAIIHAALWAYSARAGSTAEAYARMSLFDAIGLKSWSFKEGDDEIGAGIPPDGAPSMPTLCCQCGRYAWWPNTIEIEGSDKSLHYTDKPCSPPDNSAKAGV
jgi:hypothetical protein